MGNNCKSGGPQISANLCDTVVGSEQGITGFCTLEGVGGNKHRSSMCGKISTAGEWGKPSSSGHCHYQSCNQFEAVSSGCCKGCCGVVGSGLNCERLSFKGDPLTCCMNDMPCSSDGNAADNPDSCYSDHGSKQYTCDPQYRSLIEPGCQSYVQSYCLGEDGSPDWLQRWTPDGTTVGFCTHAIYRNLTGLCIVNPETDACIPQELAFNPQGFFWAQSVVALAFEKFIDEGGVVGALPGFPGFDPWQSFMHTYICCPFPSLCQGSLQSICKTKTTQELSKNPSLAAWCGCNLPPEEYEQYSILFNIPQQCAPICNRVGVIPQVGNGGDPIQCEQSICLIDGITLNLINSQIGGGINFEQICSGCKGAQCSCIVSDTTIDITNSTIGGNVVPVAEGCGSATCYQTNSTSLGPNRIPVPCSSGTSPGNNPFQEYEAVDASAQSSAKKNGWIISVVIISFALLIMFFMLFIFAK